HRNHVLLRPGVVAHRDSARDALGDRLGGFPGRICETPPFTTLLTYLVPWVRFCVPGRLTRRKLRPLLLAIVQSGHVRVVSGAHQAQVVRVVIAAVAVGAAVVEFQVVPLGTAPSLRVDEATAPAVSLVDRSPD